VIGLELENDTITTNGVVPNKDESMKNDASRSNVDEMKLGEENKKNGHGTIGTIEIVMIETTIGAETIATTEIIVAEIVVTMVEAIEETVAS
jgi:hypothetical protein